MGAMRFYTPFDTMKKFIAENRCDLKTFTDEHFPQGSFAFAALLRTKDIKVNGVRAAKNITLSAGDEVTYYTTPAQESRHSHEVIYADENVLVCDKYSGVSFEGLAYELKPLGAIPVHRLDRNTEGLIVFALNGEAERELLAAFKERRVHKTYLALCKDSFTKNSAVLSSWLRKDAEGASVKVFDAPVRGALQIITEYEVKERGGGLALVEITLHTGRTHQIRAHMAHIGCPVLGDEKYGDGELNKKFGARRQRLVSHSVSFTLGGKLAYLSGRTFTSNFQPTAGR